MNDISKLGGLLSDLLIPDEQENDISSKIYKILPKNSFEKVEISHIITVFGDHLRSYSKLLWEKTVFILSSSNIKHDQSISNELKSTINYFLDHQY
jgi:hypothetical protein